MNRDISVLLQWWSLETWSRSRDATCLETRFLKSRSRRSQVSSRSRRISVSVSKDFGLGLETLHRLFFMKFCKEFLKKWFKKMIVQNLAVQRVQWLSFLCCYVVCEMEKTVCLLPRLKFMLNSIKKCARTNDTAARNLCNERLGVLCEGLSLYCFSRSFVTKPIGLFKRGVKVSKCFFFEKQNFSQGLSKHSDKTRWWSFFCSA